MAEGLDKYLYISYTLVITVIAIETEQFYINSVEQQ